jgi:hypothetical protein
LRFVVEMFRRGAPEAALISAELIYVNADPAAQAARPWWPALRERVRGYEIVAPEEASG